MNTKNTLYRIAAVIFTLASSIFIFFNWFDLSIPILGAISESGSISLSYMNITGFIQQKLILDNLTRMGGASVTILFLLLCAILKYLCVLSSGFGIYGIWKNCIKKRKTKFIFTAQVISISLQIIIYLLIFIVNIFVSKILGQYLNISETLMEITAYPTVWLCISTVSSICSLTFSNLYSRDL